MAHEPDDLYTLRAQFWLGHYELCLEEAKSIARRPMAPHLKQEREEFVSRALLALGQHDRVIAAASDGSSTALQALALRAQYDMATDEATQLTVIEAMKSLLAETGHTSVQLFAAQLFLQASLVKDALTCVHLGVTMEHICTTLHIYIQMDRLDLAKEQLSLLKQADEDSILTQLASVHVALANGSSTAQDAIHTLQSLSEQYGPSPLLLNLFAASYMTTSQYEEALGRLEECRRDFTTVLPDTLINLLVCYSHLQKPISELVEEFKMSFPQHSFCKGLARVEGAYEREAMKYKVAA
jgi:coatomer protein complex subunit epsilon